MTQLLAISTVLLTSEHNCGADSGTRTVRAREPEAGVCRVIYPTGPYALARFEKTIGPGTAEVAPAPKDPAPPASRSLAASLPALPPSITAFPAFRRPFMRGLTSGAVTG